MRKYYVTHNGKQFGPWSVEEIRLSLEQQRLLWTDYIYDEAKSDWILLASHPYFSDAFKLLKSKDQSLSDKVKEQDKSGNDHQWFVLKGENKYGPFSYLELVRMLQAKNLYEYDYVWTKSLPTWSRVADCDDFKSDKIRQLLQSKNPIMSEVFFRRRHSRVQYDTSVIIHNNKKVWKGKSVELSPGGAGLVVEAKDFDPGQTLFLHFNVGEDVPPFNAICSIVSKQHATDMMSEIKYGVKFTNISKEIQQVIKAVTENIAA